MHVTRADPGISTKKEEGGGRHIVNILKFVGGPSKAENFVYVYMYNVQTVLYINLSRPPPCHAASVSVKVNRSMIEPTTSSANSWGRRPVTRPILKCNVFVLDMENMYTLYQYVASALSLDATAKRK